MGQTALNKWSIGITVAILFGVPVACGILLGNHGTKTNIALPSAGDNAVFAQTTSNLVTPSKNLFDQLSNFAQQDNQTAIQNMLNNQQASIIPVGTPVEVLSTGWDGDAEVQVMSGSFSGQDLYTFLNALSKSS